MERAKRGGVDILLASKYARLVSASGILTKNMVIWIQLEGCGRQKFTHRMCILRTYYPFSKE